jgi:four helix bundle protein
MQDFRSLIVWQKAHALTLEVYALTAHFPKEELYGLASQMRRSSASVPTNIAEGCGRESDPELARFCQIAMGSANELEYQLLLSKDLGFVSPGDYERSHANLLEIKRMLHALLRRLRGNQR